MEIDKNDLLNFLIQKGLIPSEKNNIWQMKTGASSYNFVIKTTTGKVFCKLLKKINNNRIDQLIHNLSLFQNNSYCPNILSSVFEYREMKGLLIEYKEGVILTHHHFTANTAQQIVKAYQSLFDTLVYTRETKAYIWPDINLYELLELVLKRLKQLEQGSGCLTGKIILKIRLILEKLAVENLRKLPDKRRIIHGDFHAQNLLFKDGNFSSILDFEELRFGYPTEDWVRLILCAMERIPFLSWRAYFLRKQRRIFETLLPYSENEWKIGYAFFLLIKIEKLTRKAGGISFLKALKTYALIQLINHEISLDKK